MMLIPLPDVERLSVKVRKYTYVFLFNPDGASYTHWPPNLQSEPDKVYVHVCNVPYEQMEHLLFNDPRHVGIGLGGIVTVTAHVMKARPWTFNHHTFLQDIAEVVSMAAALEIDEFQKLQEKIIVAVTKISDRIVKQLPYLRMHRAFMMTKYANVGATPEPMLSEPQSCPRMLISRLMPHEFWVLHAQWAEWADLYYNGTYNGTGPPGIPVGTSQDHAEVAAYGLDPDYSAAVFRHPRSGTMFPLIGRLPSPTPTEDGTDDGIIPITDGGSDG
jgi:hypothetical protein